VLANVVSAGLLYPVAVALGIVRAQPIAFTYLLYLGGPLIGYLLLGYFAWRADQVPRWMPLSLIPLLALGFIFRPNGPVPIPGFGGHEFAVSAIALLGAGLVCGLVGVRGLIVHWRGGTFGMARPMCLASTVFGAFVVEVAAITLVR
jgi:hypothetical protein